MRLGFFLGRLSNLDSRFVNTSADIGFFCSSDYMPIFVTNFTFPNSSFEAIAKETCGGNMECLFDMAATLSKEFGQATLNNSAAIERDNEFIGKTFHQMQCILISEGPTNGCPESTQYLPVQFTNSTLQYKNLIKFYLFEDI